MAESRKDQRAHPRRDLLLKVEYPEMADFLHDYTENISKGGTFIYSEKEWTSGDRINIALSFPGLLKPITLAAEVVWVRRDVNPGIGVKFLFEDDPQAEKDLLKLVQDIQKGEGSLVARKYRILVAEDNPFIQKLLKDGIEGYLNKKLFENVSFIFLQAKNGYEGLSILDQEGVDLIICDLYLPVLDGFEMIRRVRQREETMQIPILAVSAGDEESGRKAIQLGADIFLAKPLILSKVFRTICSLLNIAVG
jgi:uncharacterized protein (TIGR02266 family)